MPPIELALAAQVVIEQLKLKQRFEIVLSGGILTHRPDFANLLCIRLQDVAPPDRVRLTEYEPAYGAILLAQSCLASCKP